MREGLQVLGLFCPRCGLGLRPRASGPLACGLHAIWASKSCPTRCGVSRSMTCGVRGWLANWASNSSPLRPKLLSGASRSVSCDSIAPGLGATPCVPALGSGALSPTAPASRPGGAGLSTSITRGGLDDNGCPPCRPVDFREGQGERCRLGESCLGLRLLWRGKFASLGGVAWAGAKKTKRNETKRMRKKHEANALRP